MQKVKDNQMSEQFPSEYIEVIIYPEDRVELAKFTAALNAIIAEYQQWLKEQPDLDHNDQDLRLSVEKITEGSIKVWIVKSKDSLFDCLEGFYKEKIAKNINNILAGAITSPTIELLKSLKNIKALIKWEMRFSYVSRLRKVELVNNVSLDNRDKIQENIRKLSAEKEIVEREREVIKFVAFDKNGNAKIIVPDYSDKPVKAFLTPHIKEFFVSETENFLHPKKEYLVALTITYKNEVIEHYHINKVIGA